MHVTCEVVVLLGLNILFFYVLVAVRVVPYVIVRRPIAKIPQLWGRGGMVVGLDIAPKDPA